MSEYWKSTPKYWCKHCSTYVKDTPFERKQHEATGKHQSNLKRFLRDIQNSHERGERERERAKSEVERLSRIAGGDTSQSSTQNPASTKTAPPTARKSTTGPLTGADQKRQWAQLADMGIKVPEHFRPEMAMAGDWQVLSSQTVDESTQEAPLSIGVKKRKLEGQEDEDEEEAAAGEAAIRRGWGTTTKRYPGRDQTDLDDLLTGSISLKKERTDSGAVRSKAESKDALKQERSCSSQTAENGMLLPSKSEITPGEGRDGAGEFVKDEKDAIPEPGPMDNIPQEPSIPVFKKRKAKAS